MLEGNGIWATLEAEEDLQMLQAIFRLSRESIPVLFSRLCLSCFEYTISSTPRAIL